MKCKNHLVAVASILWWMFVCMFVWFIVPLEDISFIWRRHHSRWRAANFDLCSALMAIEQWRFFSVPHLLLHGASVYTGHLRGSVTLTPIAERLAVELSLSFLVCRGLDSNTRPSACVLDEWFKVMQCNLRCIYTEIT